MILIIEDPCFDGSCSDAKAEYDNLYCWSTFAFATQQNNAKCTTQQRYEGIQSGWGYRCSTIQANSYFMYSRARQTHDCIRWRSSIISTVREQDTSNTRSISRRCSDIVVHRVRLFLSALLLWVHRIHCGAWEILRFSSLFKYSLMQT